MNDSMKIGIGSVHFQIWVADQLRQFVTIWNKSRKQPGLKGEQMPPRNAQNLPELHIMTPNGEIVKLGKIQTAELLNDYCDYDVYDDPGIFTPMQTATFEVRWNPTTEMIYLLIHGRFPSNNWRRAHGLPVKRKIRR